jgi:PAS domain S-box-containing protein
MTLPDFCRIIYGLAEPILLAEPKGTVVAANPGASRLFRRASPELVGKPLTALVADDPEKLTLYLSQCLQNSEGLPGVLSIQPSNEQPILCKVMGGLVDPSEEQPRLVWLRLLPRDPADTHFSAYNERQTLIRENRARQRHDQRWRTAFENSTIGIMMADFEGRFLAANNVFQKMLGYTESELYQMTFIDVTYDEDRNASLELLRELVEGKRQHFQIEKRYRRKDDTLLWVRNNVALVPCMGGVAPFWFGVVEDITQRKRIEEELRLQIEVLQNVPAVAWTVTPDGRCDFINQFFLDSTGMSREFIQSHPDEWNKSGSDLPPLFSGLRPEDRERATSLFWNGIRTGDGWAFEAQHFHASDGTYHWYFDRAVPLRDSQGKIVRFVGTCADIEPLKGAQENLRESEARLQAFFENSPSLIFLKDPLGRYLYVNKKFKRVFRLTEEQIKGKRDDELFSAEQAAAFQANDRQVLEAGVPMEFEEVALLEDGQHTSTVQKFPLFNAQGEIYAVAGIAKDITKRKQEESTRRYIEERHRVVVETANDAVVGTDESGAIQFANPATRRVFGYDPTELIGKPLTVLMPEFMRKLHENGFRRYLATGQRHINWQGTELTGLHKNGQELPVEVSLGELTQNGHRVFTGFIRDISERKRVEEMQTTQVRQAAVHSEVSVAFGKEQNQKAILRECAETIVLHLDAAFAAIWTLNEPGDMLELQASAGTFPHMDGVQNRIPIGKLKIGVIAQERKPLLTNDVLNDPRISDKDWQKKGGMLGFAGYPLIVGDRTIGLLAMFSKQSVTTGTREALATAADLIAQGIERKRAEDKLRASERSLRELTEAIPQMLWSAEADGAVDYCNHRVLGYTGLPAEAMRGAGWMRVVHQDDVEKMSQAWRAAVSSGKPFQYEFRCLRAADHAYRWCISSALPLRDQKGRIIKWFGSVVDLHDWKEAQQALQTTQVELARVSRLITMGELAASIAHEVNQPLTAVTNNSNACLRLLADHKLEPEVLRRALEEIVAEGNRASAVISRIRAFIMKAPAEMNELDLNEVIQEVLALTGRELDENRVLLELQLTKALPLVLGDRVQLQQVLLNLIMNGIEAMTAAANRPRLLSVQSGIDESGNVLVAVGDSGTGLCLEADRVFTPFFTTKAYGMGMGLTISRSLVEGHGGRLWATPNSPHGAVFSFTLPVAAWSRS